MVEPTTPKSPRFEFLWKVLGRFDTYIGATLTRAGMTAAFNAVVLGLAAGKWSEFFGMDHQHATAKCVVAFALVASAACSLFSLACALLAVDPLLTTPTTLPKMHSTVFFGDVARFTDPTSYKSAVDAASEQDLESDLATQVYVVGKIVDTKFRYLKRASFGMMLSLAFIAVAVSAKSCTTIVDAVGGI